MYGPQRRIVFVIIAIACIVFLVVWENGKEIAKLRMELNAYKETQQRPLLPPFQTICLPRATAAAVASKCVLNLKIEALNTCKPFYMGTFEGMTICTYNPKEDGHMSSPISRGLVPGMEKHIYETAKRHLQQTRTQKGYLIDVGSNVGLFSFLGLVNGYHVIAVDPVAEHTDMLLRSATMNKKNDQLTMFQNAISNQCMEASLTMGRSFKNPGGTFINVGKSGIHVITLNEVLPNNTLPIHVLKMDAEGQEPWALMGATALWKRKPEMIILELFHERVTAEHCHLGKLLREFVIHLGYTLQVFPRLKLKWQSENIIQDENELAAFMDVIHPNSQMDVVFVLK